MKEDYNTRIQNIADTIEKKYSLGRQGAMGVARNAVVLYESGYGERRLNSVARSLSLDGNNLGEEIILEILGKLRNYSVN